MQLILCPKLFRGTPEVKLLLTFWPPPSPRRRGSYFLSPKKGDFRGIFGENQVSRPNSPFFTHSVIHILKAVHLRDKMGYLEALLLHPVRRKNFAGKLD